ncbi:MAG: prolyl oligopeptidase family serine peptidase [Phycisphaerales bacterium JB039]
MHRIGMVLAGLALLGGAAAAQDAAGVIEIREGLALDRVGSGGRAPVYTDAIEAMLIDGSWQAPAEGDSVEPPEGQARTWERIEANEEGWFRGRALAGGWLLAEVESPGERIMLLDARGHRHAYINGEPRGGDVYNLGITRLPVLLREGTNELLFKGGRGQLRAQLTPAPGELFIEQRDMTLPDVIRGENEDLLLGLIVTNASTQWREAGLAADAGEPQWAALPPLSSRKLAAVAAAPEAEGDSAAVEVRLVERTAVGAIDRDTLEISLGVRAADDKHKRTFRSGIDGSVQYCAVTPMRAPEGEAPDRPAMFLSLHGASVEATNQAYSYGHKDWGVVVAPTNRRPFGFDWEDWGRLDALEVLALTEARFGTDPARTYLTGHSMGGHGTWQIGAHYPDRFAAIAPSAGWRDFWAYGGGGSFDASNPVEEILERATSASRTLLLESNYGLGGVYILHGDADDNVPVAQARFMRERLGAFHTNFAYYERPGAGHWWGNQCMDWPPLFDFLRQNVRPADVDIRSFEFVTVNPGISDSCYWISVLRQQRQRAPSRVRASIDPEERIVRLETENIEGLRIDLNPFGAAGAGEPILAPGAPVKITLNGTEIETPWPADGAIEIGVDMDGSWSVRGPLAPWYKGPHRSGMFKDAFRNRMLFVYGTQGTPEENAWAFAKARYDAETFQYRGNGAVEIVADAMFDPVADPDRNIILYGNRDTNSAWEAALGDPGPEGPDVRRGQVMAGRRLVRGDDLAHLFAYPRRGSDIASVGVVGGSGVAGMRLTNQLPYFVSGVSYPDWIVLDGSMAREGAAGVVGAGFFASDWAPRDDAAWRDSSPNR